MKISGCAAQLQEHKTSHAKVNELSGYLREHCTLALQAKERIDVGFYQLQKTVIAIPDKFKAIEADEIVQGLHRHYKARMADAIIEDKFEAEEGKVSLRFPEVSEAFIPQAYAVLRYDGYDELLQATGRIHSGYLKNIQLFQQRESEQGRPVRVIVTSRISLIDKATVPFGSTVLRLLEFDENQRNAWIEVWNKKNSRYFTSSELPIKPFEIPNEEKILSLAEQPLLLLMLALFDSGENALRQHKRLDRTVLYDSLLRRFIMREQRKSQEFDGFTKEQRNDIIDQEMLRLGVAAIGMYNRKKLHILSTEIGQDLKFFNFESRVDVQNGRPAAPSDLLLGSLFFVHKSQVRYGDHEETEHGEESTAFEFLHNTFGEFLTADFMLHYILLAADKIHGMQSVKSLQRDLQKKLEDPQGLDKEWFACMSYAPLYERPVILEMIREWAHHVVHRGKRRSWNEFLTCLDQILQSQIAMILRGRNLPAIRRPDDGANFGEIPVLGHAAIYTVNLISIRTILDKDEYYFDETQYLHQAEEVDPAVQGTRPWDTLAYLWRSWFTLDNLNDLTAVLSGRREGSGILLKSRSSFQTRPSRNRLETVLNVGAALTDNITVGLAGLHSKTSEDEDWHMLDDIEKRLSEEKIDLSFELLVRRLQSFLTQPVRPSHNCDKLIMKGLQQATKNMQPVNLITVFFDLLGEALRRGCISLSCKHEVIQEFLHPRRMMDFNKNRTIVTPQIVRLMREFGGSKTYG